MRATAIIGANYGDEGKGILTDYVAHNERSSLVIRFNGGAQAGHTVCADGKRHVFSHIAAGHFAGANTLLGPQFVVNPILLRQEVDRLGGSVKGRLFIDPACKITTPFDMVLNQAIERKRGAGRHGSCGVGFGETIQRYEAFGSCIIGELKSFDCYPILRELQESWFPQRAKLLGVQDDPVVRAYMTDKAVCEVFINDVDFMLSQAMIYSSRDVLHTLHQQHEHIVFEGAQGLALDQRSSDFPHVTRSNTGLENIIDLICEAGISMELDVVYATRTYLTRHGAGPLPNELPGPPSSRVVDETNRPHEFQGALRFAPLNATDMLARISKDLKHLHGERIMSFCKYGSVNTSVSIGLTCADQVENLNLAQLQESLRYPIRYMSFGPTRNDVTTINPHVYR